MSGTPSPDDRASAQDDPDATRPIGDIGAVPHPAVGAKPPPAEDLSGDRVLRGCRPIEYEGAQRPSLGRVALLARLGKGGMGVVYYGVNPRLATEVAVKVLPWSANAEQEDLVERFIREARIAAKLKSDHLVSVLDVDSDEASGNHFLVMEYVRGQSAGGWLRDMLRSGRLGAPEADALDVCIAAARGLAAAHVAGIVHRDLKPDNILIPSDSHGQPQLARAKLADLGLARPETGSENLTGTQLALGTPGYMAPEQAKDAKRAKKPADVFALGATLYALLSGRSPFAGGTVMDALLRTMQQPHDPIHTTRPDVSPATAQAIDICLRKDPEQRFADAPALLEALQLCRSALGGAAGAPEAAVPLVAGLAQRSELGQKVRSDPSVGSPTATGFPSSPQPTASIAPPAPSSASEAPTMLPPTPQTSSGAAASLPAERPTMAGWTPPPSVMAVATGGRSEQVAAPGKRGSLVGLWIAIGVVLLLGAAAAAYFLFLQGAGPAPQSPTVPVKEPPADTNARPGLWVTSDPPGAAVVVDDRRIGATPVLVEDLATGSHTLVVTLPYFVRYESAAAKAEKGRRTEVHAVLVRETGKVSVESGAPRAKLTIVREGSPPKRYEFALDEQGGLAATEVESGAYAAEASASGYETFTGKLEVAGTAPVKLVAAMKGRDAKLSVASRPAGAEVLVDGVAVGKAPLRAVAVRPGAHTVTLRLPEHGDAERKADFAPEAAQDLGEVALTPWPVIDLGQLGFGVSALIDGTERTGKLTVKPGKIAVTLRRRGFKAQTIELDAAPGQTLPVRPGEWQSLAKTTDPEPPGPPGGESKKLLTDLRAWDAATKASREAAARAVAQREGAFRLKLPLRSFTCGGRTHEVAVFEHPQTGLEFVLVPGGTFEMGSAESETGRDADEKPRTVTLSRPFLVCRTETTQAAYERVVGSNPSHKKGPDFPLENVSWDEARDFCEKAGLALPTEAQWEYACRAGTASAWCFGSSDAKLAEFGWCAGISGNKTHPAAQLEPNAFGLYDVHGNVSEWCADALAEYAPGPVTDPPAAQGGPNRVHRGGGWNSSAARSRCAKRAGYKPVYQLVDLGVRPVKTVAAE